MRLVIELKRDAQPKKVLNLLFKYTAMQSTFGVNMLALVDGKEPRVLAPQEDASAPHRVAARGYHQAHPIRTEEGQERAHILEGLKIALDNLDAVISTIRASRTTESGQGQPAHDVQALRVQAQAILDMRLARLAALERKKIEDEYVGVLKRSATWKTLLATPKKIYGLIKADLQELKDEVR